jgi:hypothetical protein
MTTRPVRLEVVHLDRLGSRCDESNTPSRPPRTLGERHAQYAELFHEYGILHDYFGRHQNPLIRTLKALRGRAHGEITVSEGVNHG